MAKQVAVEDLPDGALAIRFLAAIQDQYGAGAEMPVDDALRACTWLLVEFLAEESPRRAQANSRGDNERGA